MDKHFEEYRFAIINDEEEFGGDYMEIRNGTYKYIDLRVGDIPRFVKEINALYARYQVRLAFPSEELHG